MLRWIQRFFLKPENVNIVFSDHAVAKIKEHLLGLPVNSVFVLSLKIDSKGNRLIFSGFEKNNSQLSLYNIEGIPIQFLNSSKEILDGVGIDWDLSGNIIVYPRVNLYTELTPNRSILRFNSNKNLIAQTSTIREAVWDRASDFKKPYLVELLFKHKVVESIYLQKNFVQVELKEKVLWKQWEEKIGNTIIQYLEALPDPITIIEKT